MGLAGDKCTYLTLELLVSIEINKVTFNSDRQLTFPSQLGSSQSWQLFCRYFAIFLCCYFFIGILQKVIKRNLQIYTKMTLLKILLSKTETLLIEWMLSRD